MSNVSIGFAVEVANIIAGAIPVQNQHDDVFTTLCTIVLNDAIASNRDIDEVEQLLIPLWEDTMDAQDIEHPIKLTKHVEGDDIKPYIVTVKNGICYHITDAVYKDGVVLSNIDKDRATAVIVFLINSNEQIVHVDGFITK